MKTLVIAGKKRSGKDTIADYVCKRLKCNKYPLADPIKEMVCNVLGITRAELDTLKNEDWDLYAEKQMAADHIEVGFRQILQRTGDELKHFFGLDCFMRKFKERVKGEEVVVVPDMRLKEERKFLKRHFDCVFIKVERTTKNTDSHRTETEMDKMKYDYIIQNNGTKQELYTKLDIILSNHEF